MSRHSLILLACCPMMILPATVSAQDELEAQSGSAPESINILADVSPPDRDYEDCEEDQDAATLTGEIIVCRRRSGDENRLYDKETAERRHAEETAFKKDPKTPDFIRDCHDQGWPPGCIRLGKVPPPAYLIDFSELPDAPPGSDADRIARGLPPLERDALTASGAQIIAEEELGLPPAPSQSDNADTNPSE